MHEGETAVSPGLATRLVAEQFPQWAGLRLRPVGVAGSDNVMIRLGDELVLRFPRLAGAAAALTVETRWLAWVAGKMPLAVPEVVAVGRPGCGYAHPWAVMRWIAGQDALTAPVDDMAAGGRWQDSWRHCGEHRCRTGCRSSGRTSPHGTPSCGR